MLKSEFKRKFPPALLLLLATMLLAGCATEAMHSKGLDLVQEGRIEEGLAKLEAASNTEPTNVTYRSDLLRTRAQETSKLLANASQELARGNLDAAKAIYERVLRIDAANRPATIALETMEMDKRHTVLIEEARKLFEKEEYDAARATLKPVLVENARNGDAKVLLRKIDEQQNKNRMAEPALMKKFRKPVSLRFRDANVKMVFEALTRTTGVNVLLDKDIRSDLKASIFVKDVSVEDAIDLILMQSQLKKKVLSDNTLYIFPDTPSKNKEFEDLKIRSFHLTNADPKVIMGIIKTLLKTKDIVVHEKTNSIVMRDTPEAIRLAERIVADQDIADPEVMLEVEVLEIDRSRLSDIGVKFPTQMSFSPIASLVTAPGGTGSNAVTTSQLTLDTLRKINGSSIGVSPIPAITLNALLQDSDTNILSSPRLRVRNHDKAKIMIGDRVPIISNSLTPQSNGTAVVTGTVTYQDVGLKLDVEPEIHLDSDVTIKVGLEVSSLGNAVTNSATGSIVYTVQTRNTQTSLRLRDGETQILAGLIEDKDTSTTDKVPALGQIPLLGHLFSSNNGGKTKKEIILSITPHIVGNPKLPDASEMEYWSGTEDRLQSEHILLNQIGSVSLSAPASVRGNPAALPPPARNIPALPPANAVPPAAVPPAAASAVVAAATVAPVADNKAEEPAASPSVALNWQGPAKAKVGDKFTVTLDSQALAGVKRMGLQFEFDPGVLRAVDVSAGAALKQGNVPPGMEKVVDQAGGSITVNLSGAGTTGNASVLSVTFEVTSAAQETAISVSSVSASGAKGESLSVAPPEPHLISLTQ